MRILKIELQNINSLKSDFPIVIDFEDEQFKDVGLYAITGSTGSGKTTILDSITIALYHSVPRFNGTKASLLDVVSHGATEAFSRVTFENSNEKYEAYWGIRLASKTGKLLSKPQEEVRLKNLTSEVTMAEQKRAVIEGVTKVTQLDYDQFLRSVMLAQGEFASFLTAKGSEKGRLLEQITGERIYKKIGQAILDRRTLEDNKLNEIKSKINFEDILTEERSIELQQNDKQLDVKIKDVESEIASFQKIVDWYQKSKELSAQTEKLEQDSKEVNAYIENHKTEFELLDLNEKAEPFSELIQNFNRNEENSIQRSIQLKSIEDKLVHIKPKIDSLTNLSKNQLADLENANNEFSAWLPKFDLVTSLDSALRSELENTKKSAKKLEEINKQIETSKRGEEKLLKNLTDTEAKIKIDEAFIYKNSFLKDVDLEISNWTTDLTTLKGNKEKLKAETDFIILKNKEVEKTTADIVQNNELLLKKRTEIEKIEKELTVVTEQLSKNNLSDLLAQKEKLALIESKWKQFQGLSNQAIKFVREKSDLLARQKAYTANLETIAKQIEDIKVQIKAQEISVVDAEKILNLEKSILKYKDDRKNLKPGEPCGLCGSKEHPYVKEEKSYDISKSELEFNKRKEKLKELVDSNNELEKNEVKLKTNIDLVNQYINSVLDEMKTIKSAADELDIDCELTNSTKINIELNLAKESLTSLNERLKIAQNLQNSKDELLQRLSTQNELINTLKTTAAKLDEKYNNLQTDIEFRSKSIESLDVICKDLESVLKTKLSKYNFELPSIENTNLFIQNIEELIADFNNKQKELDVLKSDIKVISGNVNNIQQLLKTQNDSKVDFLKAIAESDNSANKLSAERSSILPLEITVAAKRESLQSVINKLTKESEASKNQLQILLDSKREKEAIKAKTIEEIQALKEELIELQIALDTQIANSDFESRQDIEKALLSREIKQEYIQNRNRINDKKIRLKTLKEANQKAIEALNKSKSFETTEEESIAFFVKLKGQKDGLLAEKGEIKEAFRKDQEIKDRNQEIYKKIEKQADVCNVWRDLFKVIGNSKDAFNVYVQRLTLKHLLELANVHLYKLNMRYSLKMEEGYKPKEELNFNLIDHYQTDQARLVDTSSGGEKFIISLALALGLSDLASKNVKIDSLFIDEGFGSLDNNALETVISTLETLQSQGKMIGIISHVENLKERILSQIQITKKSNGVSVVDIL